MNPLGIVTQCYLVFASENNGSVIQ